MTVRDLMMAIRESKRVLKESESESWASSSFKKAYRSAIKSIEVELEKLDSLIREEKKRLDADKKFKSDDTLGLYVSDSIEEVKGSVDSLYSAFTD